MIASLGIEGTGWVLAVVAALFVGTAKTGLPVTSLLTVVLLALVFGGRTSVGIILPMLLMGDVFGVTYYNRHANWSYILKLIPWTLSGIIVALLVGNSVSDRQFQIVIALIIFGSVAALVLQDRAGEDFEVPSGWWFSAIIGFIGGFASTIGNAAFMMYLYFLSVKLPKNAFIGTGAWFFMILNLMKLPLYVFVWKNITQTTLLFDLMMLPAIFIGGLIGIHVVKRIPERAYRIFILAAATLSAVFLII